MLSNVPSPSFVATHEATVFNCLKWLYGCDRSTLLCAHKMSPLIGENNPTAWPLANCNTFINALANYWDNWR
jgi:hypothetical protein